MWPRWETASTWLRLGPRDSSKPYINISLIKGERKQIRFQAAARCCLVFRRCSAPAAATAAPPGSVPKGVVLEGRWRGGELTVREMETRFLQRRRLSAISAAAAAAAAAAAFSTPGEWTAPTQTPRVTQVGA